MLINHYHTSVWLLQYRDVFRRALTLRILHIWTSPLHILCSETLPVASLLTTLNSSTLWRLQTLTRCRFGLFLLLSSPIWKCLHCYVQTCCVFLHHIVNSHNLMQRVIFEKINYGLLKLEALSNFDCSGSLVAPFSNDSCSMCVLFIHTRSNDMYRSANKVTAASLFLQSLGPPWRWSTFLTFFKKILHHLNFWMLAHFDSQL